MLATVVRLLEKTLIRVGNDEYAKDNQSFGLTTMRDGHVEVSGDARPVLVPRQERRRARDRSERPTARAHRRGSAATFPATSSFSTTTRTASGRAIGSADVNAYLKEITGEDYTSKDFRTWAGTVLAAQLLREFERYESEAEAKKNIVRAVEPVAKRLGNTKAVCRKCYIHPAMLDAYLDGSMLKHVPRARRRRGLSEGEAAVLALLQRRLARDAKKGSRASR